MSKILEYAPNRIRNFTKLVEDDYVSNLTRMLVFEDWAANMCNILHEHPKDFKVMKIDYSKPQRVAPSVKDMLRALDARKAEFDEITLHAPPNEKDFKITTLCKEILQPSMVINKPEGFTMKGNTKKGPVEFPIWEGSTAKGVNLRLGYANMDSATPGTMRLDDNCVHGMFGGDTGSGKSVGINTVICSSCIEYPPWELQLYLADMKITELIRYCNRVDTPHVAMVAATGSTEFTMSMLDKLKTEMMDRLDLYARTGVQNNEDFRKKYDLIIPRIVLIWDEFTQLYENIKDAVQAGGSDADEQKTAINSAISALARMGRSQAMHMLLSSQNLEGTIDDSITPLFKAGACLFAASSISKTLIGNEAGSRILGKGKGIVNQRRTAKEEADNVYTRIPFINSDVKEEEAAKGKLSYLQEFLVKLSDTALSVGWKPGLFSYNEKDTIPYELFSKDLSYGDSKSETPNTGSEITDEIYKQELTKCIVMGRPVSYTESGIQTLDLFTRRRHSFAVAATQRDDLVYMLNLLVENVDTPRFKHYICAADQAIVSLVNFSSRLPQVQVLKSPVFPRAVYSIFSSRRTLMTMYSSLADENGGKWDTATILEKLITVQTAEAYFGGLVNITNAIIDGTAPTDPDEQTEFIESKLKECKADEYHYPALKESIAGCFQIYVNLSDITDDFTVPLTVNTFSRLFVWFIGMDSMTDISDSEVKALYHNLISVGPSVGIHSIVCANIWQTAGTFVEDCNFIMERSGKEFFADAGMPAKININPNSFQLFDKATKSSYIIRKYQM